MKYFSLLLSLACCFSTFCYTKEKTLSEKEESAILPLFAERHSGYVYDALQPVSSEQIRLLCEAAHSAPSSYNEQPWIFIICDATTDPDAYAMALGSLAESNQTWAKNASVLIVISANTLSNYNQKPNRWALYDTGAAAVCMALQASSIGLMAHQMGGFDAEQIQQDFNIPSKYTPMAVMAVGYELQDEPLPSKERDPLHEHFFHGSWEK